MIRTLRTSLLSALAVVAAVGLMVMSVAMPAMATSHCACKHEDKAPACQCKTPCACNQDHTQPASKPCHCK